MPNPYQTPSMLGRLPVRARVTLVFVAVMAIVLAALGVFIYARQGQELQRTVDQGLRSRGADISTLVRAAGPGLVRSRRSALTDRGENVAQIVDTSGRVIDATPPLRARSIVDRSTIRRAARKTVLVNRDDIPATEGPTRLLATPIHARGRTLVLVVGATLDDTREAQHSLAALLLLGLPIALLLAAGAVFAVVGAALAPIEAMRRRAAEIQAQDPVERLPVSEADDEVRRLGLTLNSMLDRLQAALAHERRFVSDASHELRTPLAILKAELEVALMSDQSGPELRAAVASAAEEADRLSQLAQDLLVVASSDQGRLTLQRVPLAAADILESTRTRFASRAQSDGVELSVQAPDGLVLEADRIRLEQALTNMVENALRHGDGDVVLRARPGPDGAVALSVTDRGPGFSEEFVGQAFERFSRADASRGGGGAGLGLAIVEAIATAHGGHASIENLRPGTEVTVVIPAPVPSVTPLSAAS